jgi:hypothetical protein
MTAMHKISDIFNPLCIFLSTRGLWESRRYCILTRYLERERYLT